MSFDIKWKNGHTITFKYVREVNPYGSDGLNFIEFCLREGNIEGFNGTDAALYMKNMINDSITIAKNEGKDVVPFVSYEDCKRVIKDACGIKWTMRREHV